MYSIYSYLHVGPVQANPCKDLFNIQTLIMHIQRRIGLMWVNIYNWWYFYDCIFVAMTCDGRTHLFCDNLLSCPASLVYPVSKVHHPFPGRTACFLPIPGYVGNHNRNTSVLGNAMWSQMGMGLKEQCFVVFTGSYIIVGYRYNAVNFSQIRGSLVRSRYGYLYVKVMVHLCWAIVIAISWQIRPCYKGTQLQ